MFQRFVNMYKIQFEKENLFLPERPSTNRWFWITRLSTNWTNIYLDCITRLLQFNIKITTDKNSITSVNKTHDYLFNTEQACGKAFDNHGNWNIVRKYNTCLCIFDIYVSLSIFYRYKFQSLITPVNILLCLCTY